MVGEYRFTHNTNLSCQQTKTMLEPSNKQQLISQTFMQSFDNLLWGINSTIGKGAVVVDASTELTHEIKGLQL